MSLLSGAPLSPRPTTGTVPAADHDQILHQVRMKTLAQLQQQRFLLGRLSRQLRITAPQIIDLRNRLDDAFGLPYGRIMMRMVQTDALSNYGTYTQYFAPRPALHPLCLSKQHNESG